VSIHHWTVWIICPDNCFFFWLPLSWLLASIFLKVANTTSIYQSFSFSTPLAPPLFQLFFEWLVVIQVDFSIFGFIHSFMPAYFASWSFTVFIVVTSHRVFSNNPTVPIVLHYCPLPHITLINWLEHFSLCVTYYQELYI
jgi:hypothetical protein